MYEFIEGVLIAIEPTYIIVNNQGIGYKIYPPNAFAWSKDLNQTVQIYVELIVREDAHLLYGFKSQDEKKLFNQLTTVKSIGPKTALSILAPGDHQGLIQAIQEENIAYLTNFPGIGKKTAQQMILDLQGKLEVAESDITTKKAMGSQLVKNPIVDQTLEALIGLGYSKREVAKIERQLLEQSFDNTQEALSYALKLLIQS